LPCCPPGTIRNSSVLVPLLRMSQPFDDQLEIRKHVHFFKSCLNVFPEAYCQLETARLTLLFFTLSGLDVLNQLDSVVTEEQRKKIIEWIYSLQITCKSGASPSKCGFRGTFSFAGAIPLKKIHRYDCSHLAMTYSGLACLLILGDDLSQVDRLGILASVRSCQLPDGSFRCTPDEGENDMRFVYCAAATCYMLNDWRAIDIPKMIAYITKSMAFDGAFAQGPALESHGGSTYCALATLNLLERSRSNPTFSLRSHIPVQKLNTLVRWCLFKQDEGFHGRSNKEDDSCYTFWIAASLEILRSAHLIHRDKAVAFTLQTQDTVIGGFGKHIGALPDALHSYLSLAGLSLLKYPNLRPLDASLNLTHRAVSHLAQIQQKFDAYSVTVPSCCAES